MKKGIIIRADLCKNNTLVGFSNSILPLSQLILRKKCQHLQGHYCYTWIPSNYLPSWSTIWEQWKWNLRSFKMISGKVRKCIVECLKSSSILFMELIKYIYIPAKPGSPNPWPFIAQITFSEKRWNDTAWMYILQESASLLLLLEKPFFLATSVLRMYLLPSLSHTIYCKVHWTPSLSFPPSSIPHFPFASHGPRKSHVSKSIFPPISNASFMEWDLWSWSWMHIPSLPVWPVLIPFTRQIAQKFCPDVHLLSHPTCIFQGADSEVQE